MNAQGEAPGAAADALSLLQQQNQPAIIGKLLHDLRNPVHSVRVAMELFTRLVSANEKSGSMLERAARYVGPAESAVAALNAQIERLDLYLARPTPPRVQPLNVSEWLQEMAVLLRDSAKRLEISVDCALTAERRCLADRARLSHAVLHWCFNEAQIGATLSVREHEGRLLLTGRSSGAGRLSGADDLSQFSARRVVIEAAGGTIVRHDAVELAVLLACAE